MDVIARLLHPPPPLAAQPGQRTPKLPGHEVVHEGVDGVVGVEQDARHIEEREVGLEVDPGQGPPVLEHGPQHQGAVRRVADEEDHHDRHDDLDHLALQLDDLARVALQLLLLRLEEADELEAHLGVQHVDGQQRQHEEQAGGHHDVHLHHRCVDVWVSLVISV